MILSIIGTIMVSKEVYNKWQKSPVIVSFAEKYTRVSEIPFPAVTICPETKARTSILNFTDLYNRWINEGLEKLEKEEKDGLVLWLCLCALGKRNSLDDSNESKAFIDLDVTISLDSKN